MKKILVAVIILAGTGMLSAATPEQMAEVLSQIVINTRTAIAENFTQPNKVWWLPDVVYRRILSINGVLPAAVAGKAFHPLNTGGVVVLKMVVARPRNEKNQPDAVEKELFLQVVKTGSPAGQSTPDAAYYARPIKAAEWCMICHGEPKDAPDPFYPQFKKDAWKVGEVVGAATAKVMR